MGQRCDLASQLVDWKGTADQQSGEAQQMERSSLALLQTASLRITVLTFNVSLSSYCAVSHGKFLHVSYRQRQISAANNCSNSAENAFTSVFSLSQSWISK